MPAEPLTIAALSRAIRTRALTAEQITRQFLDRIAERNPAINAFIRTMSDDVLADARAADAEIAAGQYRGRLHGIPISLKDLIDLRGTPTTAASRVRHAHVAGADATIVARLRSAGALFIGKTNLHEFAFGTTNEDSAYGAVHHPLDPSRSPGGSSGGSAAAILDSMCAASVGTDTGGSIRIPSAACGLVGLKPAAGDLPIDGVVPLSPTLDAVGPLCRSVEDAALMFDVMRGAALAPLEPGTVRGLRVGVLGGYFAAILDAQIASAFEQACARLTDAGAVLEPVEIPHAADIAPIYLHIVLAEAAALHAKTLESRADDYTPNVRIRLEMGRYVLAQDYVRALRGRDVLTHEVSAALEGRDVLMLPSLAIPAPKLGVASVRVAGTEEPVRNLMLRLTQLFNLTGHAAISLPCGATAEGLPIGLQLVSDGTSRLLQHAAAVEAHLGPGTSR